MGFFFILSGKCVYVYRSSMKYKLGRIKTIVRTWLDIEISTNNGGLFVCAVCRGDVKLDLHEQWCLGGVGHGGVYRDAPPTGRHPVARVRHGQLLFISLHAVVQSLIGVGVIPNLELYFFGWDNVFKTIKKIRTINQFSLRPNICICFNSHLFKVLNAYWTADPYHIPLTIKSMPLS